MDARRNRQERDLFSFGPEVSRRTGGTVSVFNSFAGVGSGVDWVFNSVRFGARRYVVRMRRTVASTGNFRGAASWCVALQNGLPGF